MLKVYGKKVCKYCDKVKAFLNENSIEFEYVDITYPCEGRKFILGEGYTSVPQVFAEDGTYIGNCDETIEQLS